MRRIYFLVPSVTSAKAIVDALLLARVEERHIHIVAREGTELEDLPEAGVAQRSDLIPAIEKGVAAGGISGLLAGALAVTFPPAGLVLGGGAVLGLTLFGAGFGAWMSGMVGAGLPSGQARGPWTRAGRRRWRGRAGRPVAHPPPWDRPRPFPRLTRWPPYHRHGR
jgi:hypothetical protein